jgi:threonine/homoserine/homoserine lactone efflux protein
VYLLLGLSAALPIGPVNVELARRTLTAGFRKGFALGCGAVTVDMTYAVLSSLSLGRLVNRPAVQWPVGIGGFLLLVYLGVQSLRSAKGHAEIDPLEINPGEIPVAWASSPGLSYESRQGTGWKPVPLGLGGSFKTGVLMTLLNPITLIFWFVEVPAQGTATQGRIGDVPMMLAGVFIGTFGWVVGFSGFLAFLGRWRRRWWLAAADRIGGIMLFGLAIYGLWHLIAGSL